MNVMYEVAPSKIHVLHLPKFQYSWCRPPDVEAVADAVNANRRGRRDMCDRGPEHIIAIFGDLLDEAEPRAWMAQSEEVEVTKTETKWRFE